MNKLLTPNLNNNDPLIIIQSINNDGDLSDTATPAILQLNADTNNLNINR